MMVIGAVTCFFRKPQRIIPLHELTYKKLGNDVYCKRGVPVLLYTGLREYGNTAKKVFDMVQKNVTESSKNKESKHER